MWLYKNRHGVVDKLVNAQMNHFLVLWEDFLFLLVDLFWLYDAEISLILQANTWVKVNNNNKVENDI